MYIYIYIYMYTYIYRAWGLGLGVLSGTLALLMGRTREPLTQSENWIRIQKGSHICPNSKVPRS